MQTFLPYPDFKSSVECLDRQRLGKQRVEAWQLLNVLLGKSSGWRNHPACRMWRGYSAALAYYGEVTCRAWIARGYRDTMLGRFLPHARADAPLPEWFGGSLFHASHRSNLLRKAPRWYGQFGWTDPADLPYVWPV